MSWLQKNFPGSFNRRSGQTVTTYHTPSSVKNAVSSGLSGLVSSYNQAYGAAKAANEQRYQQMLRIADQTTGQRAADITSDYANQSSNTMQQFARLGMGNTTVAPTLQAGYTREKNESLNRLADQMQQTKLGIIERREDAYPDQSALMKLIQGIGVGQNGDLLPAVFGALGNLQY